jgi:hypothetical protein
MLAATVFLVLAILAGGGWWWVRDIPAAARKLSWHQVLINRFHLSLLDDRNRYWTLDILYNENIDSPTYAVKGTRHLSIQLPSDATFRDYIYLIKHLEGVHENFVLLAQGVIEESKLKRLSLTKEDISLYREFKRNLLLKVLLRR